jgi:hypothetical protein
MYFSSFALSLMALSIRSSTAAPAPVTDGGATCDMNCQVERWLFQIPLADFYAEMQRQWWKHEAEWGGIDWVHNSKYVQDDQCSVPQWVIDKFSINDKNKPRGYDFLRPCYRHDFGYGNYRKGHRLTDTNRKKIDENFHSDMNSICDKESSLIKRTECKTIAEVYFAAVRVGGGD